MIFLVINLVFVEYSDKDFLDYLQTSYLRQHISLCQSVEEIKNPFYKQKMKLKPTMGGSFLSIENKAQKV